MNEHILPLEFKPRTSYNEFVAETPIGKYEIYEFEDSGGPYWSCCLVSLTDFEAFQHIPKSRILDEAKANCQKAHEQLVASLLAPSGRALLNL
jgi:hypothetical protein